LVQGRYDQLRLAGAENVTPAHAVGPALAADCVDGPLVVERGAAGEPLNRPQVLVVEPAGPEGEVNLSVSVDIAGSDADVVALGLVGDDDPRLPVGVLVPDDPVFGDGDDVGFFVAIDIGQRHGVADFADFRVDFASFKLRNFCGSGGEARE